MPVDIFTRQEFEAALPVDDQSGADIARYVGLVQGEHCYRLPCSEYTDIFIRSSIHGDTSAACGEDSIRVLLVPAVPPGTKETRTPKPIAKKLQRWTTRLKGWQERMLKLINRVAEFADEVHPCPTCGRTLNIVEVTKEGPNKGKIALSCTAPKVDGKWPNHYWKFIDADRD